MLIKDYPEFLGLRILQSILLLTPPFLKSSQQAFFSWFLARTIGYRSKTIKSQLRASYPDFDNEKIQKIAQLFYSHLSSVILNTVHPDERDRLDYQFPDISNILSIINTGRSCLILGGHIGHWEQALAAFGKIYPGNFHCLYKPLRNTKINQYLKRKRVRAGVTPISFSQLFRQLPRGDKATIILCLLDQNPDLEKRIEWLPFLGIKTAFDRSIFDLAVKENLPLYYLKVIKTGNLTYRTELQVIAIESKSKKPISLLEDYVSLLDENIREQPSIWLWSHRRWKRTL